MLDAQIIAAQRAAVVAEALSWVGTPFHHEARVKGAGVDCAQFLLGTYCNAGMIPHTVLDHYPPDWHMHRDEERFVANLLRCNAVEVAAPPERAPLPGDICLWRFGRSFSHAAIVVNWPMIIHAFVRKKVAQESANVPFLRFVSERVADQGKPRPMRVFVMRGWV